MSVPAHDQRDFEFARKYKLPIRVVITPADGNLNADELETALSQMVPWCNPEILTGSPDRKRENRMRPPQPAGHRQSHGQLSSARLGCFPPALLGTPVPMVLCESCGTVPVPEDQLPVVLPTDVDLGDGGQSPLHTLESFYKVDCQNVAQQPGAKPTHSTLLSVRPGTSTATHPRMTRSMPLIRRRADTGCRWINTSAASNTLSFTCFTPGFSSHFPRHGVDAFSRAL